VGDPRGQAPRRKRVAVYASDPLTAAGVAALLVGRPEFVLLSRQQDADADIVVVAADSVTVEFVATLRQLADRTRAKFVVILADHWSADPFAAAETGIAAVVPRSEVSAERLARAISTVSVGGADLSHDIQARLLARIRQLQREVLKPRGLNAHGLDNREVDVLRLLAAGCDLSEIAGRLSYSERTVKNILRTLTSRLGVRNRTQAVAHAMRVGAI
jgi:DNA-binding NarL/FixJ family response regulator